MRFRLNFIIASLICLFGMNGSVYGQLYYEGLMFEGHGQALLNSATATTVSPDGKHVYTVSFESNAVTIFSRDASSGNLTFVNSFANGQEGVSGISGAYDIVISPDGQQVFVAGSTDDAIAVFNRNSISGQLSFVQVMTNNVDGVSGIDGVQNIGMSSDGNHLYVTGTESNAIAVFNRNVATGMLNFVESHTDDNDGINNMAFPLDVIISPDGKNVYVASFNDNAVNIFARNSEDGSLTFKADKVDGTSGVSGISGAYATCVSPDGEHVYVTGSFDNAVAVFSRNTGNGNLTFVEKHVDNTSGVDGLAGAISVNIMPDGSSVYVCGANENAVAVFSRNSSSGALTYMNMQANGNNGITGMNRPVSIMPSADGENLYATSFGSSAVVTFDVSTGTGDLTYKNTQTVDNLVVNGLTGVDEMAFSADNKFLYTASNTDDGVGVFERDVNTGELSFVEVIIDGTNGVNTLNGINAVTVSPDGKSVYTTAFWEHSVTVFDRDASTGKVTYREVHRDGISGVDGLNGSNNVVVSNSGANVYATSFWEHGIAVFSRDQSTGALTFQQTLKNGVGGVDGIIRPSSIIESADQKHVYVTGSFSNAIAIFERDQTDGMLTYKGVIKDGQGGVDGLRAANSVSISPDGLFVYAAGTSDNAVSVFSRDNTTGLLTFVEVIKNGIDNVGGIGGITDVKVSSDGKRVYTSSSIENAAVIFDRDAVTGKLTFVKMQVDGVNSVNGIQGSKSLILAPDGRNIYVSGATESAIGIFSCTYEHTASEMICEGQSITIAGKVYDQAGHYQETVEQGSCRTIVDLQLEVQSTSYTQNKEICQGSSYTFNGITYSSSGQYNGNFTSAIGCDSIVTLNLDVVTEYETTVMNEALCEGESIMLGGNPYSTTGTYTETFTSADGCDSMVMLNLTVNPNKSMNLEASICDGEFYLFGTSNYTSTGTYTKTFASTSGCDSIVTLQLNVISDNTVYNETICAGDAFMLGGNPYSSEGTHFATVTTTSGCSADVTLNLTVLPVSNITLNEAICSGESYSLGGNSYNSSGTYNATMTSASGCDSTVTLNLVVAESSVTMNETICEGSSFMLGNTPYTTTGTHTEVFTSNLGCGDSTIVLNLTVVPNASTENATICEGDVYTLGNNSYTSSGTYTEVVTGAAGCETTLTLNLEVAPNHDVYEKVGICLGDSYTIGNQVFDTDGSYTINMTTATGCDSIINLDLVVNNIYSENVSAIICEGETYLLGGKRLVESGSYSEVMTSSAGCDSTVNLTLTVRPSVQVTPTIKEDDGSSNGSIFLTVDGLPPYTFAWSHGPTSQVVTGLANGTYTVMVTNSNGCAKEYTFEVNLSTNTGELKKLGLSIDLLTNPVSTNGEAQLVFESSESHELQMQLYTLSGQLIGTDQISVGAGKNNYQFEAPKSSGIYLIRLMNEDGKSEVLRLAVQ